MFYLFFEVLKKNLIFDYNSFGNRINFVATFGGAKHVYDNQTLMLEKSTYYILDASGNQLSMYSHIVDEAEVNYYLTERNIYGSSRLGTLPSLNIKSSQFELYSNVVIIYNVDSEEIENVFESMVESPIGKPKKQEQTARESTNWEKNGPLGVIIGEENADRFRNWESENLSGKAPLPLRLLVKVLPGPALVDAGFTLATGKDMMSPNREGTNGLGYGSSATTIGTGVHDLLGGAKKIAKFSGRFNVFLGVGIELFETYKEGGFDNSNKIEDEKAN